MMEPPNMDFTDGRYLQAPKVAASVMAGFIGSLISAIIARQFSSVGTWPFVLLGGFSAALVVWLLTGWLARKLKMVQPGREI